MAQTRYLIAVCVLLLAISANGADAAGLSGGSSHGSRWLGASPRGIGGHGTTWSRGGFYRGGRLGGLYDGGYYGGYLAYPRFYYDGRIDALTPQPLGPVIPATFVLGCHRSQETVTVPSEAGGSRKVTITRC